MMLGNPHFPWRGRYRFEQVQLTIPGTYDVAGASLIGSPVVNIGWNKRVAWSHTVSTAYRFTPYEYRTVPGSPTTYLTEDGPTELDRRVVRIRVKRPTATSTRSPRTSTAPTRATCSTTPRPSRSGARRASSRCATPTASTCAPSTPSSTWARPPTSTT